MQRCLATGIPDICVKISIRGASSLPLELFSLNLKAFNQTSAQSHLLDPDRLSRLHFHRGTMSLVTSFITALISPFVLPAPTVTSSKPKPPPGYQTVYNTCNSPANLYCCSGTGVGGAADEPTDTQTGCMSSSLMRSSPVLITRG